MKIITRVVLFIGGASLVTFAWLKAHKVAVDVAAPGAKNTSSGMEVLVVVGAMIALMAFAPSAPTLGRWMSLKPHKRPKPAHFRRRRART